MSKALVILSGGQDSTTCLFLARQQFDEIHAVTFNYGQKHAIEIDSAVTVAKLAGVASHEIINVPDILKGTSPLVNKDEKVEQYDNWGVLPGGLEKTFVPNRNSLFIVIACNRAALLGINDIFTGVCQEDFGGYPDCRRVFIDAIQLAMSLSNDTNLRIHTPLMYLTKAESVKLAHSDVNCWNALAYTHTDYEGLYPPTGKNHATLLRTKGFEQAGLPDPLVLRAVSEGLMPLPETANYHF